MNSFLAKESKAGDDTEDVNIEWVPEANWLGCWWKVQAQMPTMPWDLQTLLHMIMADSDKSVCSPYNWKWAARSPWLTLALSGTAPVLPTTTLVINLMLWSLNLYCIKGIPILLWGPHLLNSLAKEPLRGHGEAVRIWPSQSLRR